MPDLSNVFHALPELAIRAWHALSVLVDSWPVRMTLQIALAALVLERILGWPQFMQNLTGHPVEWIGGMIERFERRFNRWRMFPPFMLKLLGAAMVVGLVIFWGVLAWMVHRALFQILTPQWGWLAEALLASVFLAQSSLRDHVRAVCMALERHGGNLEPARSEVGRIVGRHTAELDETGIVKAAVESLAENTSDGIVAPAFWLALFGLPGIVMYKVVNTCDSMVGYRSERFHHFGWLAARLDDVLNFMPARLTGLMLAMAAGFTSPSAGTRALHVMWRDARKHVSPNAGWPEAAMAGALDISLGGPRSYPGLVVDLPWMGDGRKHLVPEDIRRALSLYGQMLTLMLVIGFFFWLFMPD